MFFFFPERVLGVLAALFHALRFWQKSCGVDLAPLLKVWRGQPL